MKRKARQSRPQMVCVLADNSGSMQGPKAEAATAGIREMLLRCQTTGPRGADRSYFRIVLVRFGSTAEVDERCNMTPVRQIDPESVSIVGDGGGTDMTAALEIAYDGLQRYMASIVESHPERSEHPLPLVLLFSDGHHNGTGDPADVANKIKSLRLDGDPITIAAAGVATDESDSPDETMLRRIASPECYFHITETRVLGHFLAEVGSSGASSPREVAQVMKRLPHLQG
jgi:uncharacterized protein YegL